MIQLTKLNQNDTTYQYFYINTLASGTKLLELKSQQTTNSTTCIPTESSNDRYSKLGIRIQATAAPDLLRLLGYVFIGYKDLPMGFYDATIYANSSASNLDPSGLTVLWNGLMNLTAQATGVTGFPAVEYDEYNSNDTDTESVYVTI